jgi:hypothetical protein
VCVGVLVGVSWVGWYRGDGPDYTALLQMRVFDLMRSDGVAVSHWVLGGRMLCRCLIICLRMG